MSMYRFLLSDQDAKGKFKEKSVKSTVNRFNPDQSEAMFNKPHHGFNNRLGNQRVRYGS